MMLPIVAPLKLMRCVAILLICGALALLACRQATPPNRVNNGNSGTPATTANTPTLNTFPVRTEIGFATRQKFLDHFEKHGHEFGNITAAEYLLQAQTLRDRPAGGAILESVRAKDRVITRFDNATGAFVAFNPDLTIRTYFKPNDGTRYFWRQSKR